MPKGPYEGADLGCCKPATRFDNLVLQIPTKKLCEKWDLFLVRCLPVRSESQRVRECIGAV
eukprot:139970-Rhodomonas_salina.1